LIVRDSDRSTEFYLSLVERQKKKLESLRSSNDKDHDAIKTANIRGRIAEVNGLLEALTKAPQTAVPNHIDPYIAPE